MKIRLIIGIILIIGSIASLVKALDVNKDVSATSGWSCVDGEIIKSELVVAKFSQTKTGAAWSPEIEYCYTVNDKEYTSNMIMFGGVTPGRHNKMYERYIDSYPKDSIVKVYYDPTQPENAVLKPLETWGFKKYYLLASVLAIFGILHVINYFTGFGEGLMTFLDRSN